MALVLLAGLQSGRASEPASSSTLTEPPRILSSNPRLGETEVDPSLTEIRITFDRDMPEKSAAGRVRADFVASPSPMREDGVF